MKISIAMATYNGERFLASQLGSLAQQSFLPSELVVCDDGSTDSTVEMLKSFAAPFQVRIYKNESRLGYGDNFLKAASLCSGDLIAFCDQDDTWREHKLATCEQEFSASEIALLCHAKTESNSTAPIGYDPKFPKPFVIRKGKDGPLPWSVGCATVVRRDVINEFIRRLPAHHPGIAHDNGAFFMANEMGDIKFIPDRLIVHRVHGHNVTNYLQGFGDKLAFSKGVRHEAYEKQAKWMSDCAATLDAMGLARAAANHRRVARTAATRARIYAQGNTAKRLAMISHAALTGAYRKSLGMHGLKSLAKDVLLS